MEFGFEPAATRFEQDRAISACRESSNVLEPGRTPVRSCSKSGRSEAGRRLVADLLARASSLLATSELDDRPNSSSLQLSATSLGPVCDQDSVTEFGLYRPARRPTFEKIDRAVVPSCEAQLSIRHMAMMSEYAQTFTGATCASRESSNRPMQVYRAVCGCSRVSL